MQTRLEKTWRKTEGGGRYFMDVGSGFLRKTRELQKSVFFSTPVKQQRKRIDRKTPFALNF